MTLPTILALGLLFGMQHALEADHLAAVATLAARERSLAGTLRQGIAWGVGHTLTLLVFGGVVLLLGASIPQETGHWLEAAVGVMLILLGADLLRRLVRGKVHFHSHRHSDGAPHFHAHSHQGESGRHNPESHEHHHLRLPGRAIAVGMVHGLAGSAALVLVALDKLVSPLVGGAVTSCSAFGVRSWACAAVGGDLAAAARHRGAPHAVEPRGAGRDCSGYNRPRCAGLLRQRRLT